MSEIIEILMSVGIPMVMAIVYSSLIYRRRALLKGEEFSPAKFWGTLVLAGWIGLANYLTNGVIIPTESLLGILEASAGAIIIAESLIKFVGAKFTLSPTVTKLSEAIYNYLVGLQIPDTTQEGKTKGTTASGIDPQKEKGSATVAPSNGPPRGTVLYEVDGIKVRLNPNPDVAYLPDEWVYQMVFPNGQVWSGNKDVIEILMGDSDAAKAWRARYGK